MAVRSAENLPDTMINFVVYQKYLKRWIRVGSFKTAEGADSETAEMPGHVRIYRETLDLVSERGGK